MNKDNECVWNKAWAVAVETIKLLTGDKMPRVDVKFKTKCTDKINQRSVGKVTSIVVFPFPLETRKI